MVVAVLFAAGRGPTTVDLSDAAASASAVPSITAAPSIYLVPSATPRHLSAQDWEDALSANDPIVSSQPSPQPSPKTSAKPSPKPSPKASPSPSWKPSPSPSPPATVAYTNLRIHRWVCSDFPDNPICKRNLIYHGKGSLWVISCVVTSSDPHSPPTEYVCSDMPQASWGMPSVTVSCAWYSTSGWTCEGYPPEWELP